MNKTVIFGVIIGSVVAIGGGMLLIGSSNTEASAEVTAFAQCLEEEGATFFGAFWCPHCQEQKQMFSSAAEELPYVECSTPDGQGQTQVCQNENIQSYPTWEFADGSRETGVLEMETLAEKTGCELPSDA